MIAALSRTVGVVLGMAGTLVLCMGVYGSFWGVDGPDSGLGVREAGSVALIAGPDPGYLLGFTLVATLFGLPWVMALRPSAAPPPTIADDELRWSPRAVPRLLHHLVVLGCVLALPVWMATQKGPVHELSGIEADLPETIGNHPSWDDFRQRPLLWCAALRELDPIRDHPEIDRGLAICRKNEAAVGGLAALGLVLLALWVVTVARGVNRVTIDADGVAIDWLGVEWPRRIPWSSVRQIRARTHRFDRALILELTDGRAVRIPCPGSPVADLDQVRQAAARRSRAASSASR